jgi:hypothetical protein
MLEIQSGTRLAGRAGTGLMGADPNRITRACGGAVYIVTEQFSAKGEGCKNDD